MNNILFHSEHEAYTHILLQREEIQKSIENIDTQISSFLMNIRQDNFRTEGTRTQALKELGYLEESSRTLEFKVGRLNTMAGVLKRFIEEGLIK